ncbi:TetR/AcrR family transcriptional regulator [Pediococcus claussenii]|uniref:Transcriptional regulator, TetR family n=1 Tax=Pediococcus claussenii (strain ATCC BAA-344 / DSM 14800 / JCM 18046 / KCTC 3811 / LMG 21948 / P06) TaxID=701521 RepID=G8PDK3_PEDCP|nr:TetR/AcrR family transcriptional regulator [Pediococcus claussenii]AEV95338.1 Transcriptional regulator, TetR family [Pediococcus claussenii ATCC BAA-344]ANZ68870.1 hypothetical protein AYR57_00395 [Pediococcus claussenii]ANZ70686.1 hypothetical protein AYR58_00395 [Pediococcus claussenii]KRN19480.1 hypothetical protein IV79_GL001197 [Pediococcus claussenii]
MVNSSDPRVLKTKKKLTVALINLLKTYSVEDLNVRQLTDEAGITRGSFYSHFTDKDDFVEKTLQDIVVGLFSSVILDARGRIPVDDIKSHEVYVMSIGALFDNIAVNYQMYTVLLCNDEQGRFAQAIENTINLYLNQFTKYFQSRMNVGGYPLATINSFYVHGLVGMIIDWLSAGMVYTPHYMAGVTAQVLKAPTRQNEMHPLNFFTE